MVNLSYGSWILVFYKLSSQAESIMLTAASETWIEIKGTFFNIQESGLPLAPIVALIFLGAMRLGVATDYLVRTGDRGPSSFRAAVASVFKKKIYQSRSFKMDLEVLFLNAVLVGIGAALSFPLWDFFTSWAQTKMALLLSILHGDWMFPISNGIGTDLLFSVTVLLVGDIAGYWAHRAQHEIPFLWEFHKVHHCAKYLTPFTNLRRHYVDYLLSVFLSGVSIGITTALFAYFFKKSPSQISLGGYSIIFVLQGLSGSIQHTNIWWSFGFLDKIVTSPAVHALHHSIDPKYFNSNYAPSLSFLDVIFGTFKKPTKRPTDDFGVGIIDETFDWEKASLFKFYFFPFVRAFSGSREKPASNSESFKKAA